MLWDFFTFRNFYNTSMLLHPLHSWQVTQTLFMYFCTFDSCPDIWHIYIFCNLHIFSLFTLFPPTWTNILLNSCQVLSLGVHFCLLIYDTARAPECLHENLPNWQLKHNILGNHFFGSINSWTEQSHTREFIYDFLWI